MNLNYELGTKVRIVCSDEQGDIIARGEYMYSEPSYLLRYADQQGRAVEQWWPQSALSDKF